MKFVTFQGAPLALLLAPPNYDSPITVDVELPNDVEPGLSALESRRAFAAIPRYTLTYKAYLGDAYTSTVLRLWLLQLQGQTVAVPMWPDQVELAADAAIGATVLSKTADNPSRFGIYWLIASADLSTFEILTINSIGSGSINLGAPTANAWPAGSLMWPLLFGRLKDRPKPEAITDETMLVDLVVKDESYYSRGISPFASPTSLPLVGSGIPEFATLALFSYAPTWEKPLDSTAVDVIYKQVGFIRTESQQAYANPTRRGLEFTFELFTHDDISAIEEFFANRRGQMLPFMVPTWRDDLRLSADLPVANPQLVPIEPTEFTDPFRTQNPGEQYLAFIGADGSVDCQEMQFVDGAGIHIVASQTNNHPMASTNISHLLLARFADPKLSWSYRTDGGSATVKIKFVEVPNEYAGIISLPGPVFLYRFTHQMAVPTYYRFTSYESMFVTNTGETFLPAPFSHGSLKLSAKLDQETIQLESFNFLGNPLRLFIPFALEAKLILDILEANAFNLATPPRLIFTGRVSEVDTSGNDWKAICQAFGGVLERPFPNFFVQKVCNYVVYTPAPKCGVLKSNFAVVDVAISAIADNGITISINNAPANTAETAAAAVGQQYFGLGLLESGSGATFEQRSILNSVPIAGGVQLTINAPLNFSGIGLPVTIYPGCDGAHDTCLNRFNNLSRFGGHAYVPDANPTIKAMSAKMVNPGKK